MSMLAREGSRQMFLSTLAGEWGMVNILFMLAKKEGYLFMSILAGGGVR